MLSVMLCYAALWFLYESEQNLMIHYEIDHILLENHSTPQISTISSILVKNLESRKACMDE